MAPNYVISCGAPVDVMFVGVCWFINPNNYTDYIYLSAINLSESGGILTN